MNRALLYIATASAALAGVLVVAGRLDAARYPAAAALILGAWLFAWATVQPEFIDDVTEPPVGGCQEDSK